MLKDKILCIEARKPFLILEKALTCPGMAGERFEPEKSLVRKEKRRSIDPLRPLGSYKPDDVRTSEGRKVVGWQMPIQEILQHVMACEKECPQLDMALDKLFTTVSEYQKQAA